MGSFSGKPSKKSEEIAKKQEINRSNSTICVAPKTPKKSPKPKRASSARPDKAQLLVKPTPGTCINNEFSKDNNSPAVVLQMARNSSVVLDEAPKQREGQLGMVVDDRALNRFKSQVLHRETGLSQHNYENGLISSLQGSREALNLSPSHLGGGGFSMGTNLSTGNLSPGNLSPSNLSPSNLSPISSLSPATKLSPAQSVASCEIIVS